LQKRIDGGFLLCWLAGGAVAGKKKPTSSQRRRRLVSAHKAFSFPNTGGEDVSIFTFDLAVEVLRLQSIAHRP
jgi:hypothetical protein